MGWTTDYTNKTVVTFINPEDFQQTVFFESWKNEYLRVQKIPYDSEEPTKTPQGEASYDIAPGQTMSFYVMCLGDGINSKIYERYYYLFQQNELLERISMTCVFNSPATIEASCNEPLSIIYDKREEVKFVVRNAGNRPG